MRFEHHRVINNLEKSILKGNRLFYLYSNGINDNMFYDYHYGILTLKDNLKNFFLEENDCDWFISLNSEGVFSFYNASGEKKESDFLPKPKNDGFDLDSPKTTPTTNSAINQQVNQTEQQASLLKGENILKKITERMIDGKKIALFFDGFEWIASLYDNDNSKKIPFFKKLKEFLNIRNSFVVVSLKNIEHLKSFDVDVDLKQSNVLYVGNPNKEEIEFSFTRFMLKNYPTIEFTSKDMSDISFAIRGSDKTLKEGMNILKSVIKKSPSNLKISLFEESLDKSIFEKIEWDDVILEEKIKNKIEELVESAMKNHREAKKGVTLYGPPGVGKTYLAKALANKFNCYFMAPSLADLKGRFVGESAKNVQEVFKKARSNSPTILFLDEVDTIFPNRNSTNGDGDSFGKDMVNQFLVEIDGFSSGEQKIFIIGATNRVKSIDDAIISRLPPKEISLPRKDEMKAIFDLKLKPFKFSEQSWHDKYLDKSIGLSGRDIDNFCKDGFRVITNKNKITETDFKNAFSHYEETLISDLKQKLPNIEVTQKKENSKKMKNYIGNDLVKKKIQKTVDFVKKRGKTFGKFKVESIFIYGEPGCGKTLLVESVAGENSFHFIRVSGKDIAQDYLKKLGDLKEYILKISKINQTADGVILFFDDLETISGVRDVMLESSFSETLKKIKEIGENIIVFGATSVVNGVNDSILDIFDEQIKISNPDKDDSIKIMKNEFNRAGYVCSELSYKELFNKLLKDKKEIERDKLNASLSENIYFNEIQIDKKIAAKIQNLALSNKEILSVCKKIIKRAESESSKFEVINKFLEGEI